MAPVGPCRLVYAAAALSRLFCGPSATPTDVKQFFGTGYTLLDWQARRCFEGLLDQLPRRVAVVKAPHCCWEAELVDRLKLDAPRCEVAGGGGAVVGAAGVASGAVVAGGAGAAGVGGVGGRGRQTQGGGEGAADDQGHEHGVWQRILDHAINIAAVSVLLVLVLLHKQLVKLLKRCGSSIARTPPTTTPRPLPFDPAPAQHAAQSTSHYYCPPSPKARPSKSYPPAKRRRPVQLVRHPGVHRPLLPARPETSVKVVAATLKPWERWVPQKKRRKNGKRLDLSGYPNCVVWAAGKLTVPAAKFVLDRHQVQYGDGAMGLLQRCDLLDQLLRKVGDIDWVVEVKGAKAATKAQAAQEDDDGDDEDSVDENGGEEEDAAGDQSDHSYENV